MTTLCAAGRYIIHADKPTWRKPCPNPGVGRLNITLGDKPPVRIYLCTDHMDELDGEGVLHPR